MRAVSRLRARRTLMQNKPAAGFVVFMSSNSSSSSQFGVSLFSRVFARTELVSWLAGWSAPACSHSNYSERAKQTLTCSRRETCSLSSAASRTYRQLLCAHTKLTWSFVAPRCFHSPLLCYLLVTPSSRLGRCYWLRSALTHTYLCVSYR